MKQLTDNELMEINGGSFIKGSLIGGGIIFIIGMLSGFVNPNKCNN